MREFLVSVIPSVGAILFFWLALRAIFQADRRERAAVARFDAEYAPAAGAPGRADDRAQTPGDPTESTGGLAAAAGTVGATGTAGATTGDAGTDADRAGGAGRD